jgi:DNA-binding protein H-NS
LLGFDSSELYCLTSNLEDLELDIKENTSQKRNFIVVCETLEEFERLKNLFKKSKITAEELIKWKKA